MDIGCFEDDFVGCDVDRNSAFAYNAQDMDGFVGMCELDKVGYEDLPILSYTFLNQSLTRFAPYARSSVGVLFTSFLDTKEEKLNYLEGRWKDGTPFTEGNFGYNPGSIDTVHHLFPGDPTKDDEWSMKSSQLGQYDMAMIAINKKGLFEPKEIYALDAVITYTNEQGYLTEIPLMQSNIDYLQSAYEECLALQLDTEDLTPEASLKLYPNPARNHLKLESDSSFDTYKITDAAGQVVQEGTANQISSGIQLRLASGVYTVSLFKDAYIIHRRLVVVK